MNDALPPAMFIADALGLDFLNSIAVPVDTQIDWLRSGEDLVSWLEQAGLVRGNVLQEIRGSAGPGELDAVAAQARALREWFRGFVRERKGAPLTREAIQHLEPLNRLLARDEEFGQIAARPGISDSEGVSGLEWVPQRRWRSPDSLLLPIAKAMAELLATADFTYVKACEWPTCTRLFLDTTGGRMRRWCSMAVCGNRAKQAGHRERAMLAKSKKTKKK
jgi:predicted RNA-binding Zn ribbon-like protein